MRMLLLGAATLALATVSVQADPGGKGNGGNGKGQGNGHAAAAQGNGQSGKNKDKGQNRADRNQALRPDRAGSQQSQAQTRYEGRSDKSKPHREQANRGNGNQDRNLQRQNNPGKEKGGKDRDAKGNRDFARSNSDRDADRENRQDRIERDRDNPRFITRRNEFSWTSFEPRQRQIEGCPPGLAKKRNGCMPPGQAKKQAWLSPRWYDQSWDSGSRYRYHDGYMLRLGGNDRVLSYLPLLGGALGIGEVWPQAYSPVTLPRYYNDYYGLGERGSYRYYDDTIYRIDPQTSAIQSIAALLTGDDFRIGQQVPAGYDVYNVPYPYRDSYYDGPESHYRYSDGYVYQVDPETRLIMAAIDLLI